MKKGFVLVLALLMLAMGGNLWAEPPKAPEPLMAPGDLALSVGIGYGFFWGAIDVSGGVEFILGKFVIADFLPLTYGAAVKASYYSWNNSIYSDWTDTYLGGGAFATLHLGLKDFDWPSGFSALDNMDTYIGLGAGFFSYTWGYSGSRTSEFRIGLRTTGGASYFFTPNFALNVEYGYYGYYNTGLIGILFKL
ncbi:hypothetical protein [Gracilinema caldarium]|uniref:hypothetical protein n=1 Tax=Gracilinema caldarium TaxID=215591 RepID=UPI0026F0B65C|nr:hypothetical protein [Gracilinema caldarium]